MIAIFKRDFRSFFQNVLGFAFLAAMALIASLYFRVYNLSQCESNITGVISSVSTILVFAIPILTMRSFPDERKNKVDQLTLTSPISIGKIVLGKYLALISIIGILTIYIGSLLLFIASYTDIMWGLNLIALLGFFLYACAFVSICLFLSSFTESQVLAAIIGIIVSFVLYLLDGISFLLIDTGNAVLIFLGKAISAIGITTNFQLLLNGIFDITAVIYYLSIIALFLFLTTQTIQKRRFTASIKNLSIQAFSISMIVVVIAVVVFGNLALSNLPTKYTQFDVSSQGLYTLSDSTKEFVKSIEEPVTIYVYIDEANKNLLIDRVLTEYHELNTNISIVYKDPYKSPKFYEKFTDSAPVLNSLMIETANAKRYIDSNDLIIDEYEYNEYGEAVSYLKSDIEGCVTATLFNMFNGVTAKVGYITGHNEVVVDSGYYDAVNKLNCEIVSINLMLDGIPDDVQVLFLNGPTSDYSSDDAQKIIDFLDNGGTAIITTELIEDISTSLPNFAKVLDYFKATFSNGMIVDQNSYFQSPICIIPYVQDEDVTTGVFDRKTVWMPYSKAVLVQTDAEDVISNPLLISTYDSYIKYDLGEDGDLTKSENDILGPFNVAVCAKKTDKGTGYIFGSPMLFSDVVDEATSNASSTIFMNIVKASVSDDAVSVPVIPAKSLTSERFIINNIYGVVVFLILLFVLPLILIITGVVIWVKRRVR